MSTRWCGTRAQRRGVRLGAADVQAAIHQRRIDADDFGVQPLRPVQRERGLARRGRAHQRDRQRPPVRATQSSSPQRGIVGLAGPRRRAGLRRDRLPDRQRVGGGGDVVHAHDRRAVLHRDQRAATEPCTRSSTVAAGQRADHALARQPGQHRHAEFDEARELAQQLRLCSSVLPKPKPGSITMRFLEMPPISQAKIRCAKNGARRRRRRRSAGESCIGAARPACASAPPARRARPRRRARRRGAARARR